MCHRSTDEEKAEKWFLKAAEQGHCEAQFELGRFYYLADVNEEATSMYDRLVRQLSEKEGVTEQLKAKDQIEWVRRMNSITARAREVVKSQIIYTV